MPRRGGAGVVQVWHGGSPSLVSFRPPTIGGLDGTTKEPAIATSTWATVKRKAEGFRLRKAALAA